MLGNESDPAGTYANLQSFNSSAGIDTNHSYPAGYGTKGTNAANASAYGIGFFPTIILVGPDKKMINNDIWPISSVDSIENKFPSGAITPKICSAPTRIKNIDAVQATIYPNPASDVLYITCANMSYVSVQDVTGSIVYTTKSSSDKLDVNVRNLANGVYFVTVYAGAKHTTIRFIKE